MYIHIAIYVCKGVWEELGDFFVCSCTIIGNFSKTLSTPGVLEDFL